MRKDNRWMCCVVVLLAFQPIPRAAHAQPAAENAARITKSGGVITRDKAGEISSIGLRDASDDIVESIDFTVFPQLQYVAIGAREKGSVTDRSLAHLQKKSTGLKMLAIEDGAKITAKGLSALLKKHPSIRSLDLHGPAITNETLTGLNEAKELMFLKLYGTKISDDGLKSLVNCEALAWLDVQGHKITDAGMVHVGKLEGLAMLNLRGTAITDKGLQELSDLGFLGTIVLSGTKVTAKGREALQESLPDLRIEK
jgi:hypothetical protein